MKEVDGPKASLSKMKHVATKLDDAQSALSVLLFCLYVYKKIPKAESPKSKASFIRELKSHIKDKNDVPQVLRARLAKLEK